MSIERPNPWPKKQPYAVLHMQHASYFAYEEDAGYSVCNKDGNTLLETYSFNDVATLFVEAAADL